jgi:hypothetical protein
MKRFLILGASLMLSGCGTLQTSRLEHRYEPDTAVTGVSYALPKLQYKISVTHILSSCGTPGNAATQTPATSFSFDTQVDAVASYVPDERFNVDYRKLSGLFRTSTFSIEYYPNGTIKSLGAAADDKTGDAIKSAAKLAGGVVALTSGRPDAAVDFDSKDVDATSALKMAQMFKGDQPPTVPQVYDCSATAVGLLSALNKAKKDLKDASTALADANNTVEMLSQRFALKITKDGDADRWDAAITGQLAARREVEKMQKALAEAKKPLSVSFELTWPNQRIPDAGKVPFRERYGVGDKLSETWSKLVAIQPMVKPNFGESDVTPMCSVRDNNTDLGCLSSHMDLVLDFVSDWPNVTKKTDQQARADRSARRQLPLINDALRIDTVETTGKTMSGIFYREPARGGLIICLQSKADTNKCVEDPLLKPKMVNFPQAGQLRFVPFKVLPFQGKDQSIDFTEDGYPSKIALKSTKAAGAEALGAAADGLTTLVDAFEKREEERRSDTKAARDDALAERVNELQLLETQAKIIERQKKPSQPSAASLLLAEVNADIEMKRAQILQLLLAEGLQNGAIDPVVLFGKDP